MVNLCSINDNRSGKDNSWHYHVTRFIRFVIYLYKLWYVGIPIAPLRRRRGTMGLLFRGRMIQMPVSLWQCHWNRDPIGPAHLHLLVREWVVIGALGIMNGITFSTVYSNNDTVNNTVLFCLYNTKWFLLGLITINLMVIVNFRKISD